MPIRQKMRTRHDKRTIQPYLQIDALVFEPYGLTVSKTRALEKNPRLPGHSREIIAGSRFELLIYGL